MATSVYYRPFESISVNLIFVVSVYLSFSDDFHRPPAVISNTESTIFCNAMFHLLFKVTLGLVIFNPAVGRWSRGEGSKIFGDLL